MQPIVKICGLMREEDVQVCVRHGADIVGFVVDYPQPVPWNLDIQSVKQLMKVVSGQSKTCIVTGGTPDKVINLILETRPDYVQLHFDESLVDTAKIINETKKYGVKIIKTLFPNTPDLEKAAVDFHMTGVDALLFDSRTPDNVILGGKADIAGFIKVRDAVKCPVILAGGINPANVEEIIKKTNAEIIDLMTGVEQSPGVKDEAKVISLFKALNRDNT